MSGTAIRLLQGTDIPALVLLGKEMHAEGAFSACAFSEGKVRVRLEACLVREDHFCVVAEREKEGLVGLFLGAVSEDWFSDDPVAKELALYVTPAFRRRTIADHMLQSFYDWGEKRKVKMMGAGTSSGINNDGVKALYEDLGYTTVGYTFRKKVMS